MPWSETPRHIVLDLRGVATFDAFRREIGRHFVLSRDHARVWAELFVGIFYQVCPLHIAIVGWGEFEGRMPRYARRLRRFFEDHGGRTSREAFFVAYDADVPSGCGCGKRGDGG